VKEYLYKGLLDIILNCENVGQMKEVVRTILYPHFNKFLDQTSTPIILFNSCIDSDNSISEPIHLLLHPLLLVIGEEDGEIGTSSIVDSLLACELEDLKMDKSVCFDLNEEDGVRVVSTANLLLQIIDVLLSLPIAHSKIVALFNLSSKIRGGVNEGIRKEKTNAKIKSSFPLVSVGSQLSFPALRRSLMIVCGKNEEELPEEEERR
jgi:hypothetical protein